MDLFEYQARDLFEAHGVPVLRGIVARTPGEARAAAEQLGGGGIGFAGMQPERRGQQQRGAEGNEFGVHDRGVVCVEL